MAPIILFALGGLALYAVSQSSKPTPSKTITSFDGTQIPVPTDKGYTIIIPCKQFDIYNEEASYQYAYHEFAKIIPEYVEAVKKGDMEKLADMIDKFQLKLYGCNKEDSFIMASSNYYAWAYRLLRAGLKALIDRKNLFPGVSKQQLVDQANFILAKHREIFTENFLDVQGLPTSVEGDFIQ